MRREGLVERAVERVDRRDGARALGGQHEHLVAGAQHAAGDLPGVAAVVALAVADDVLDREAQLGQVAVGRDLDRLEVLEQRRPPYHGIASERSTTLSPCSALIGMKAMSCTASCERKAQKSRTTASKASSE